MSTIFTILLLILIHRYLFLITDIKSTGSPSSLGSNNNTNNNNNNNPDQSSSPYTLTSLPPMNNGGVPGLMLPHAPMGSYHTQGQGQRQDSNIKVETPENLTAHVQYSSQPSPGKHHASIDTDQAYSHSVNALGLAPNDSSANLGTVSVGAS